MDEKRRCRGHLKNGQQCKKAAILGGYVCATHGGSAPQVKRKAAERLAELVDPAINRIEKIINNPRSEMCSLLAAKDVLDRTGHKPPDKIKLDADIEIPGLDLGKLSNDQLTTLAGLITAAAVSGKTGAAEAQETPDSQLLP